MSKNKGSAKSIFGISISIRDKDLIFSTVKDQQYGYVMKKNRHSSIHPNEVLLEKSLKPMDMGQKQTGSEYRYTAEKNE